MSFSQISSCRSKASYIALKRNNQFHFCVRFFIAQVQGCRPWGCQGCNGGTPRFWGYPIFKKSLFRVIHFVKYRFKKIKYRTIGGLSQPGGENYAHHITAGTPKFSDLPTALRQTLQDLQVSTVLEQRPNYGFKKQLFWYCCKKDWDPFQSCFTH